MPSAEHPREASALQASPLTNHRRSREPSVARLARRSALQLSFLQIEEIMASSEQLEEFLQISELCPQPPWFARLEGRDHYSGDTFVIKGENSVGGDALSIHDTGPTSNTEVLG